MLEILNSYQEAYVTAINVTLKMCIIAWSAGILLGFMLSFPAMKFPLFRKVLSLVSLIFAAIPVLVLLLWIHYPLQIILNVTIEPFWTSAFVLAIINIFAVTKSFLSSYDRIPKDYIEIAHLSGLDDWRIMQKILLPILGRMSLPLLLANQVNILHLSLFAGLISVNELYKTSLRIISIEHSPVEVFSILALIFIIVSLPLYATSSFLEKKNDGWIQ